MKKRVVFICHSIKDAPNSTRYQRALMLSDRYDCCLICSIEPPDQLKIRFRNVIKLKRTPLFFVFSFIILFFLKFKKYKSVHTQYISDSLLVGFLAKVLLNYRWVFDLWDHPTLEFQLKKRRMRRLLWNKLGKKFILFADAWIVGMHPLVLDVLPAYNKNTSIIYSTNGIDMSLFNKVFVGSRRHIPNINTDNGHLQIGYSGSLSLGRGVNLISDILWQLERKRVRCDLHAFGIVNEGVESIIKGHNNRSCNKIIIEGNKTYKDLLPSLDKCQVCLCILDEGVLNYRYAYPVKIFEYMAVGNITLATKTFGTSAIIEDGVSGFLMDNNAELFVNTILKILSSDKLRESIISNAKGQVNRFDWSIISYQLFKDLDNVF